MNPLLSLVVPVYNVASYLERCLASLAAQNLDRMEIVLVDDGSTDDCPAILARYAAQHPQMRVIRQANGGLSAARNTGLDAAQGEYLAFADSDDFVEPWYYRDMLQSAHEQKLDMAHGNGSYHFRDDFPADVMSGAEVLRRRLAAKTFLHMVWLHLYRRGFIQGLGLRFVPRLIHEDVLWTTRAFMAAQRVAYLPRPGYHYRQRVRPLPQDQLDIKLAAVNASSVHNARGLDELANRAGDDAELQRLIRWQLVDGGMSIFHKLRQMSPPARRAGLCNLREQGVFGLLWRNADEFAQRRRIARAWLKSWLA